MPRGQVRRRDDDAAPRIERAGRGDADTDRRGQAGSPRIGADLGGNLADPCDDRLDPFLIARRNGTPCVNRQVGGDERRADLGASEVDRQDRPIGELVHVRPFYPARTRKRRAG